MDEIIFKKKLRHIGLETKNCEFLHFKINTHELISISGLFCPWLKWDIFETFKNMNLKKIVTKIVGANFNYELKYHQSQMLKFGTFVKCVKVWDGKGQT